VRRLTRFVSAIGVLAVLAPGSGRADEPLPEGVLARLGSPRFRLADDPAALTFAPDGRTLVAVGHGSVRVWDVATGQLWRRAAVTGEVAWLRFSADGQSLVWIGFERIPKPNLRLRVLNLGSGRETRKLDIAGFFGSIRSGCDLSADGKWLAADDLVGNFCLFDATSGKLLHRIGLPGAIFADVTFSPDGKLLAVAIEDDTVRLFDTATGRPAFEMKQPEAKFRYVRFSPDGRLLATTSDRYEGGGVVWDLATRKEHCRLARSPGGCPCFSADGKRLAVGNYGIAVWDLTTAKVATRLNTPHVIRHTALSPDGRILAAATDEGSVLLWDVATGRLLPQSAEPAGAPRDLRYSADGRRLLGLVDSFRAWDVNTGREVQRFAGYRPRRSGAVDLSPDEQLVATTAIARDTRLMNAETGFGVRTLTDVSSDGTIRFSPDGRTLFTGGQGKTVRWWDVDSGKERRRADVPEEPRALAVSADGRRLAALYGDKLIPGAGVQVWDTGSGQELRHQDLPSFSLEDVALSHDGKLLAAVGRDREHLIGDYQVRVWEVDSGAQRPEFPTYPEPVTSVAFSPDGRSLAVGGRGFLHLLELATGRERHRFLGHEGTVLSIAFAADGRTLAASSADAPVFIWDVIGGRRVAGTGLRPAELEPTWADLAGDDAASAFRAIRRLVGDPGRALPLLRERLRPSPSADPESVRKRIAELDDQRFAVRQKAAAELERVAESAELVLRQAARDTKSIEVKRLLERVLGRLKADSPESLRAVRAVEALEAMARPEAAALLKELAAGAAGARLTREAVAALRRAEKRLGESVPAPRVVAD
jgi:WD40 repeat protein